MMECLLPQDNLFAGADAADVDNAALGSFLSANTC